MTVERYARTGMWRAQRSALATTVSRKSSGAQTGEADESAFRPTRLRRWA
jgi:hypothetical protein